MIYFIINDKQQAKLKAWVKEHECSIRGKRQGAIGGALTYRFTPTSINEIFTISCACGNEQYIDDGEWEEFMGKK